MEPPDDTPEPASLPRLPVVLAHGFLGFAAFGLPSGARVEYFRGVRELLARAGIESFAPEVPALGSIRARGERLAAAVRARFGDRRVHVVAHSMGGLDAREAIARHGLDANVAALVTLGTPHRGSPLADWISHRAGGAAAGRFLERFGIDAGGLRDLTREACLRFDADTPPPPALRAFSFAGARPANETALALQPGHAVVRAAEGENDGLVSVESARWGEFLGARPYDHLNLVGWWGPWEAAKGLPTPIGPLYAEILGALEMAERQDRLSPPRTPR